MSGAPAQTCLTHQPKPGLRPDIGQVRCPSRVPERVVRHIRPPSLDMSGYLTPRMGRFLLAAIKGPHASLAHKATHSTCKHIQVLSLELQLTLPQASLQSEHPKRDLSYPFE
jgi:hypothetical protein